MVRAFRAAALLRRAAAVQGVCSGPRTAIPLVQPPSVCSACAAMVRAVRGSDSQDRIKIFIRGMYVRKNNSAADETSPCSTDE